MKKISKSGSCIQHIIQPISVFKLFFICYIDSERFEKTLNTDSKCFTMILKVIGLYYYAPDLQAEQARQCSASPCWALRWNDHHKSWLFPVVWISVAVWECWATAAPSAHQMFWDNSFTKKKKKVLSVLLDVHVIIDHWHIYSSVSSSSFWVLTQARKQKPDSNLNYDLCTNGPTWVAALKSNVKR